MCGFQIELLFKLWKQHGGIDEWRSTKPWTILCEVYAKLIAMVFQHWLLVICCWGYPDRSLVKAAQTIRTFTPLLSSGLSGLSPLGEVLERFQCILQCGCRINPHRKHPNTYQRLLALTTPEGALA